MKHRNHVLMQIAAGMNVEAGTLPGLPVVEIAGREQVLIENHKGIIEYGCGEIRAKVRYGCVSVQGNHLKLAKMTCQQLIIRGCIESVQLIGRTGNA